jgi:hypothetical protein
VGAFNGFITIRHFKWTWEDSGCCNVGIRGGLPFEGPKKEAGSAQKVPHKRIPSPGFDEREATFGRVDLVAGNTRKTALIVIRDANDTHNPFLPISGSFHCDN